MTERHDLIVGQYDLGEVKQFVLAQLVFRQLALSPQDRLVRRLGAQNLSNQPFSECLIRRFLQRSGISDLWATIPANQPHKGKTIFVETENPAGNQIVWKVLIPS